MSSASTSAATSPTRPSQASSTNVPSDPDSASATPWRASTACDDGATMSSTAAATDCSAGNCSTETHQTAVPALRAASSAIRVLPAPGGPTRVTRRARVHASSSSPRSCDRPISLVAAPGTLKLGRGPSPGPGRSSPGSWDKTACSMRRNAGPGSSPRSSTSRRRASA